MSPSLNDTQIRVLVAVRDGGGTLKEIGDRLGMSRGMVASRLSEIYKRLGVAWMDGDERRAAALRRADKLGLLPDQYMPVIADVPTGELL